MNSAESGDEDHEVNRQDWEKPLFLLLIQTSDSEFLTDKQTHNVDNICYAQARSTR